jgi:lincosamide nucleotidyltransferase B/F
VSTLDRLDAALRAVMQADPRVRYAVAYGSRTQLPNGERQDDEYSDLEYYVYPQHGQTIDPLDQFAGVTPVLLSVINPFGTPNFVTPELHRIELHVAPADRLAGLLDWSAWSPEPASMLVKDTGGVLARLLEQFAARPDWTPEPPQATFDNVLNSLVAVRAFLLRGEQLRAQEWHSLWVIGGLTRLARHAEPVTQHLPQPPAAARRAELDLSPAMMARLSACAGGIGDLAGSWAQALRLAEELAAHLGLEARTELVGALRL